MLENNIPVVGTKTALELDLYEGTNVISEDQAVDMVHKSENLPFYSTSENAIAWISEHLAFSGLPDQINLFKNKSRFRDLIKAMYPDFYYREVSLENLRQLNFDEIPLPAVIKPTVGFFSMGVHMVLNSEDWIPVVDTIFSDINRIKAEYPDEVVGTDSFIIEQFIEGEEFAVDAYFNSNGEAVVLGIMKHIFSSRDDVSDRVYITSVEIIRENLDEFTEFAQKMGGLSGVKNFPVHIELRRDASGLLMPIEVNPLRFGGWCTTADISYLAFGVNSYLLYYKQLSPDWDEVLQGKEDRIFSVVVLDNSTGLQPDEIAAFDYEKLLSCFENPMHLRQLDINEFPVFGFLFTETGNDSFSELQKILHSDLNEFIILK